MDRKKRHRALARLRDYFLLERKQREIKEASTDQRASVYEYRDAAQRRLEAARVLLEAGLFHEALVLFSAGAAWLAKAALCWRDPTADVTSLKGDELGRRLSVLLEDLDDPTATRYARILARTASGMRSGRLCRWAGRQAIFRWRQPFNAVTATSEELTAFMIGMPVASISAGTISAGVRPS